MKLTDAFTGKALLNTPPSAAEGLRMHNLSGDPSSQEQDEVSGDPSQNGEEKSENELGAWDLIHSPTETGGETLSLE